MNHLIDWQDVDETTWQRLIYRAIEHASQPQWRKEALRKNLGLLFFNPSLRTRTSMEVASHQLGAQVSTINVGQGTWGFAFGDSIMNQNEAEHIEEAIGVLSSYFDALGVRLFASLQDLEADESEEKLRAIVDATRIPIINLESAFYHPCQALADASTLVQRFGKNVKKEKFVLSWTYHPRALPMAVPNSTLLMATRLGMDVTLACPPSHILCDSILEKAAQNASVHGKELTIESNLEKAIEGATVIYAKAWGGKLAYSDSTKEAKLREKNIDWRITERQMARTENGLFMHCLPVRRGVVVDTAVLKSEQSLHLKQASFRLFAQKAILESIWNLL